MKAVNMWFVGRWISVKDQLPEPETVVLACFDNGEVSSVWQDWKNSDDPFTYIGFPNEDTQTVTHWMQLPKPPNRCGNCEITLGWKVYGRKQEGSEG